MSLLLKLEEAEKRIDKLTAENARLKLELLKFQNNDVNVEKPYTLEDILRRSNEGFAE